MSSQSQKKKKLPSPWVHSRVYSHVSLSVCSYNGPELRVRLGEWDVNHDVEFYPYVERDVSRVTVHPEFYAGTLANDIAILRLAGSALDLSRAPHISPACLPSPGQDYTGSRCWTTGWGKDAFGEFGKYQNILKVSELTS